MAFSSRVDQEGTFTSPVLVDDLLAGSMQIGCGIAACEGQPDPTVVRFGRPVGVIDDDDQRERISPLASG